MIYSTYAYSDTKGRRLGIFAQQMGDTIEIVVLPFKGRRRTRNRYSKYPDCGGHTFGVSIVDNKPGTTLHVWCKRNYQKFKL